MSSNSARVLRWIALAFFVVLNIYFAATSPATSAEAVVYTRYVSRPLAENWTAPFDANIGVPYLLLARPAKWIGGVSELTLRFPSILGSLLFGLAFIRVRTQWKVALLVLVASSPEPLRLFNAANGAGLGLAFLAWSVCKWENNPSLAGFLVGVGLASHPTGWFLAYGLAAAADAWKSRNFWRAVDNFLLPAFLTTAVLLCPAVRIPFAGAGNWRPAASDDLVTRRLVLQLPKNRLITVSVSPAIEPGANFYRRRFHLNWKAPASPDGADRDADYYVLSLADSTLVAKRSLNILSSEGGEILARINHPMASFH